MGFGTKARRCIVAIMCALTVVSGIGEVVMNLGNVAIVHSIEPGWKPDDLYHYRDVPIDRTALEKGRALLDLAERLRASRPIIQWAKGRTALLGGDYQAAANVLTLDTPDLKRNPVLYLDTLTAYKFTGADDSVIALYDLTPPEVHAVISDTVALAYVRSAQTLLNSEQPDQATVDLQSALNIRPIDLYAQYQLWWLAADGSAEKARFGREIADFSAEAVSVRDVGLLRMVFDVFPALLHDGLWERARGHNMIAYWVWQQPDSLELESLVNSLIANDPQDATWCFYLGELYDRRGQREQAEAYYQRAARQSAEGLLIEQRLAKSSLLLADDEDQLRGRVARLLGLPIVNISLGADMVSDPFVVKSGQLADGWKLAVNQSAFYWQYAAGQDTFDQLNSLRITDLWWPFGKHETGTDPFAQYETSVNLPSNSGFLISIWYRIDGPSTASGQIFLGTVTDTFAFINLPNYDGRWTQLTVIGSASTENEATLMLRNLSAASIWFYHVTIRPIDLGILAARCRKEICVQFSQ
jgi:tetratricopeptide (TPR) repeat protein